jgi:hypothetical protein
MVTPTTADQPKGIYGIDFFVFWGTDDQVGN